MIIIFIIRGYSTTTTHFGRSIPTGHIYFLFDDSFFFRKTSDFGEFADISEGFPGGVTSSGPHDSFPNFSFIY